MYLYPRLRLTGREITRQVARTLVLPAVVFGITIIVASWTHKGGWLSVGGAVISALGALLWANRLVREPTLSDNPPGPTVPLVALVPTVEPELKQQARENLAAYVGVWVTIAGGIIGSAGPFLLDLLWKPSP
jgi:hypothetical protein